MSISKFITKNPQKIGEMRDMGINLNDFEGPIDTSTFGGLIKKAITRVQPRGIMDQPFVGRDFSMFDLAKMGQLPNTPEIIPGYNQEMDIDNTGRITLRDRFRDLAGRAQEGILNTLTGQDRRSSLTRAGLGSILFGFNPLTAILGAFAGSKLPGITSALQQGKFNPFEFVQEQRAKREAERLAQIDREEKARLASRIRSGGGTIDSGNEGGYGGTGGEGPSAVGSSGMLGGGV